MHHLRAGRRFEHGRAHMGHAADAPGAVGDVARRRLGRLDQIAHILPRRVGRHHHKEVREIHRRNGFEIFGRVIGQLLEHMRLQGHVRVVHLQQRVAVWHCTLGIADGDETVGTRLVVNDELLPPIARQALAEDAHHRIGAAAGRIRRDGANGLGRKGLRHGMGHARGGHKGQRAKRQGRSKNL
ncbi:hypothetical protein D3C71_1465610 [compost metagenome]